MARINVKIYDGFEIEAEIFLSPRGGKFVVTAEITRETVREMTPKMIFGEGDLVMEAVSDFICSVKNASAKDLNNGKA